MGIIPTKAKKADMSNSEVRKEIKRNHAVWQQYIIDSGEEARHGIDYVGNKDDIAFAVKLPAFIVVFDIPGTGKFCTVLSKTEVTIFENINEFYLWLTRYF